MSTFQPLFEHHAAASLEKQWLLAKHIGDADWLIDFETQTISFGTQLTCSIQELGSESELSQTWLWAWANTTVDSPAAILQDAHTTRLFGTHRHIREFTEPMLDLAHIQGHQLALVAVGICQRDGYYRGPYEGGAVFVLLDAPILRTTPSAQRMVNVFSQLIATYDIHHRNALQAYGEYHNCQIQTHDQTLNLIVPTHEVIEATFDSFGRIVKLDITSPLHA
jgi:hypothetical protein